MEGFQHLTSDEMDALAEAPALVIALIGGADGKFDSEERAWSDKLAHTFSYATYLKALQAFYTSIKENLMASVDQILAKQPDTASRNNELVRRLESVDPVIGKLEPELAAGFYHTLLKLADETAKASGGFLRIGAVGNAEHQWVKLPMLTVREMPREGGERQEGELIED